MHEYRYSALKIIKDENGDAYIDDDFEPIEVFMLADSEDMARTTGNTSLLNKYPDAKLDDFDISVTLK